MKANYKTRDPKGWCGDPKRGSALGRTSYKGNYDGLPLTLQQVRLDSGGYDTNGTYFGIGQTRLFWVASQNGEIDYVFWAKDRNEAKETVRKDYPTARFYR